MKFSLQSILASLGGTWQKLSNRQKTLTVALPLLVLGMILSLVLWASRPDYAALFQGPLAVDEAGGVVNKLKELKIPYQLNDGGTTILVPRAQVAELRIQLSSAGLPKSSKFSFDTLNDLRFGETDADRKIRYTLGLQDELETTLKTLSAVQDARVHLVLPEESLFTEQQKEPTAAVTIKLQPGSKLAEEQVRGIANLLASSIEGLKPEKVTIIDTNGQVLSEQLNNSKDSSKLSVSQLQLQQNIDDNLQRSAQSMLDRAFGPGKSIVRVAGTLDFDQVETKKEIYGDSVVRSKQNKEETSTNSNGATGVPGGTSNIPGYQTVTGTGTAETKKTESQENYEVDKTEEHRITNPGTLKRMSVSVLLDAPSADPKTIQTVKDIVTSAVGVSAERGDQIQVAAIPFNNKSLDEEKQAMADKLKKDMYTRYALAGAALLVVLIVFVTWLVRRAAQAKNAAMERAFAAAQLAAASQPEIKPVNIQNQDFKEKVESAMQTHPDEITGIIKVWLQEER